MIEFLFITGIVACFVLEIVIAIIFGSVSGSGSSSWTKIDDGARYQYEDEIDQLDRDFFDIF